VIWAVIAAVSAILFLILGWMVFTGPERTMWLRVGDDDTPMWIRVPRKLWGPKAKEKG